MIRTIKPEIARTFVRSTLSMHKASRLSNTPTTRRPHKSKAIERDARFKEYLEDRKGWVDRRAADSQERAVKNVEIAKDIRARWLGGSKE
ncbi:hypothetical protein CcaverHIS002_0400160 [Cutaneotrichosporon cavernicola]|nr:hypothetical protein CcaverHIS002_0400160 [Cutaneotrichosporon cavernicola]